MFQLVASGLSFVFQNKFTAESQPELASEVQRMTDLLRAKFKGEHDFGVLFNGFTESSLGYSTKSVFGKYPIQVDSGGLQMISLGETITQEGKDKVYRTQAKWGDIGMSFDSIPVKLLKERAERADLEAKQFDPDILEACARQSGKDLARQIEVFLEENTKCKPLMIVQGNCVSTYKQWSDYCLSEVPKDHWQYIAGVSSGAGAIGNGPKEDIERIFALSQLEVPDHMKKQYHLLGFGSMHRLIPVIEFKRSGLFGSETMFSYDSTKATGNVMRGIYQGEPRLEKLSRFKDAAYTKGFDTISKLCKTEFNFEMNEQIFHDSVIILRGKWKELYGSCDAMIYERNSTLYAFFLYSVYKVMEYVRKMEQDDVYVTKLRPKDHNVFLSLKSVKDQQSYEYWKKHHSRFMKSAAVKNTKEVNSLEDFFV